MGGNVAVNNTIWVAPKRNLPNCCNNGRNSSCLFNTTWHSSITIRSNRCNIRCRATKSTNSLFSTPSGVIKTIDALSGGRRRSYTAYDIPNCWYRACMSSRNDINGTTTIVNPALPLTYAGNINNILFPLPVGMIAIIGLCPCLIACNTSPWFPRNTISVLPIMYWNASPMSHSYI